MAPTLLDGDRVLVSRLAYLRRRPRRGDIVLATVPNVPGQWTIKRVHAGGGEAALTAFLWSRAQEGDVTTAASLTLRLRPDEYILRGDNPSVSSDSRHWGVVPSAAIRGRVWYRYWPPSRRGRIR